MRHRIYAVTAIILSVLIIINCSLVASALGGDVIIDEFKSLDLISSSSNIVVDCGTSAKYDDTSRLNRVRKSAGHIVYNFELLKSFELTAYETFNTTGLIIFETSADGEVWTELVASKTVEKDTSWDKVVYKSSSVPSTAKYLRVTMKSPSSRNVSFWETQLGEMRLEFNDGGRLITERGQTANGLKAVLKQDFNSLPADWNFDETQADYILAEEKGGRNVLTLSTVAANMASAGCSNPSISAVKLGMDDKIYRMSFKMAVTDSSFDRNVIIATERDDSTGTYLYPISFGSNGNIGYRNSEFVFTDFETPYPYEVNRFYDISVIIDTVNAKETVYIDGVKIGGMYQLNTSADGGIYEIKISNMDTANVSGKTYIDSVTCEAKATMQDVYTGTVEFGDMGGHWAQEYAEALVYQGAASVTDNFMPEGTITADELFTWILKALDMGVGTSALNTAKNAGIAGAEEFSAAADTVSRQQMVYVIEKAFNDEAVSFAYSDTYSDRASISEKYLPSIKCALGTGLISGDSQSVFRPLDAATRAETAATLARAICDELRFNDGYVIGIYSSSEWSAATNALVDKLSNSFDVRILGDSDIINGDILNPDVMACLILMNDVDTSERGIKVLRNYLENGGDIVSCGSDIANIYNNPNVKIPMFEGYEWDPYMYDDAVKIVTAEGQTDFGGEYLIEGEFTGTTAVGFTMPVQSKYIPVLEAYNKFDKRVGYAAGVLVEYEGMYNGGSWLFYGVDQPEFYSTETFVNSVNDVLKTFSNGTLFETYDRDDMIAKNKKALAEFEITEPRPEGYVTLSEDGSHFIDAHGEEMFVVGCSTFGPAEFPLGSGSVDEGTFDIEKIENWFRLASEAGINVFRYWGTPTDPQAVKVMINFARKYNIYLYPVCAGSYRYDYNLSSLDSLTKAYGDEPMVIGYDLCNEPSLGTMFLLAGNTDEHPFIKVEEKLGCKLIDVPELDDNQSTIDYLNKNGQTYNQAYKEGYISEELRMACVAAETFIRKDMLQGDLYSKDMADNEYQDTCPQWFIDLVGEVVKMGLDAQRAVVRKNAPHAHITMGYLNHIAMWPGASELDWWNHHAYTKPDTYQDMIDELAVFDKQYNMNPNIPSILGEFGLSGGHFLANGEHVNYDTTAAFEFLHYLYPFAKGYGGAVVWDLVTWNPVNYRYYDTSYHGDAGWNYEQDMYRERHGSFIWDGNPNSNYKIRPIGALTKKFEEFRKTHTIGDADLEIFEHGTQLKLGYVFTADDAFYVSANNYKNDKLEFMATEGDQPVVLIDWDAENIEIMATHDMTLKIKPQSFVSDIDPNRAVVEGNIHSYSADGAYMVLELAECESIILRKGKDSMVCVKVNGGADNE